MDYIKLLNEMKDNYSNILSTKDIDVMDKMIYLISKSNNKKIGGNIKDYINILLDKIWNKTLTNIYDYKSGKEFCFLTQAFDFYPEEEYAIPQSFIKLVNDKNIKSLDLNSVGRILKFNFRLPDSKPILPIHFKNGVIFDSKLKYDVLSFYSLNPNFSDISSTNSLLDDIQEEEKLDIIYIDKIKYNSNELDSSDVFNITVDYIGNYLERENLSINLLPDLRDIILSKYEDKLKELYTKFVKKKIKRNELDEIIYKIIDNEKINLTNKKLK